MSSKRSSSKKSSSKKILDEPVVLGKKEPSVFPLLFSAVIGGIFFYYMTILEKEKCQCSEMWQREYIKYYALAMVLFALLQLLMNDKTTNKIILSLWFIASLVNIYAIYTYGNHLHDTQCNCATKDHYNLYNFMVIYNYLQIFMLFVSLLLIIYISMMML